MVFEEMQEEFDPFRYWYLPGIEYGSGERGEPPSASEAFVPLDPVAALPGPGEKPRPAMRAYPYRQRVGEGGFLRRRLPVLLPIPFQDGGFDEPFVLAFVLAPDQENFRSDEKRGLLDFGFIWLAVGSSGGACQDRQVNLPQSPGRVIDAHPSLGEKIIPRGEGHHPFAN